MLQAFEILQATDENLFATIYAVRHENRAAWVEISYERATDMLEALPPIYFKGGFMMGEPSTHDYRGKPVYTAVVQHQWRFFARDMTEDTAADWATELRAFLRNGGKAVTA